MRRARLALAATALGTAAMLGGYGEENASEAATMDSAKAAGAKGTKLALRDSQFGRVLFNSKGRAIYLFSSDTTGSSTCYDDCAAVWPPFYARGKLEGGPGVNRKLLGKTTRTDGRRQVSYAGHPLYFYVHDPRGEILCHNVNEFGGEWLVVRASGKPAP